MKTAKILPVVTVVAVIIVGALCLAGSVDNRNFEGHAYPVFRVEVPQIVLPNGAQAAVEQDVNINGTIRQITVTVNNNDGDKTMTVALEDEDDAVLWSEAAIAESATTVFQYATLSATDLNLAVLSAATLTVKVTPSGDPGASTGLVDVVLYGD